MISKLSHDSLDDQDKCILFKLHVRHIFRQVQITFNYFADHNFELVKIVYHKIDKYYQFNNDDPAIKNKVNVFKTRYAQLMLDAFNDVDILEHLANLTDIKIVDDQHVFSCDSTGNEQDDFLCLLDQDNEIISPHILFKIFVQSKSECLPEHKFRDICKNYNKKCNSIMADIKNILAKSELIITQIISRYFNSTTAIFWSDEHKHIKNKTKQEIQEHIIDVFIDLINLGVLNVHFFRQHIMNHNNSLLSLFSEDNDVIVV